MYDLGEDLWLCMMVIQRGWRIRYCALSDVFTQVQSHCEGDDHGFLRLRIAVSAVTSEKGYNSQINGQTSLDTWTKDQCTQSSRNILASSEWSMFTGAMLMDLLDLTLARRLTWILKFSSLDGTWLYLQWEEHI